MTRALLAVLLGIAAALGIAPGKAGQPQGSCQQIHPASLIQTTQGWSITLGDGHAAVLKENVKFWNGELLLCLPAKGFLELWLPSSYWPQFASADKGRPYGEAKPLRSAVGGVTPVHDSWINDPAYKDVNGMHCCGTTGANPDCVEIPPAAVRPSPDGQSYQTPTGPVPNRAVYTSQDGKTWLCSRGGVAKCLMIQIGG